MDVQEGVSGGEDRAPVEWSSVWLLKPVPPQNPVTADDGDMLRPFAGPGRRLQADVVDKASSPRAVQFHLEEAASSGTLKPGTGYDRVNMNHT